MVCTPKDHDLVNHKFLEMDIIHHDDNASNTAIIELVKGSLKRQRGTDATKRVRITVETISDPYDNPNDGGMSDEEKEYVLKAMWSDPRALDLPIEEQPEPTEVKTPVVAPSWFGGMFRKLFLLQ